MSSQPPDGYPATPNLDRMALSKEAASEFFEIIEWLAENTEMRLGTLTAVSWSSEPRFVPAGTSPNAKRAVSKYFGFDYDEALKEQDRVLTWVQETQRSKA